MHKKAFTLVELIVVITILAILGTIAFISLSGYSKEARDSKRITDTSSLLSKINIEEVRGTNLSDLITTDTNTETLKILGKDNPNVQSFRKANFKTLKEDEKNFEDPFKKGQYYPMAYAIGGSGKDAYKFVQIASVSEKNNRNMIKGNYYKLEDDDAPSLFYSEKFYTENPGSELVYDLDGVIPKEDGGEEEKPRVTIKEENNGLCSDCKDIIVEFSNGKKYVLMDRNLGATEAGLGTNAFGNFYQWGNNTPIPNTGEITDFDPNIDVSDYGPDKDKSYYGDKNKKFIKAIKTNNSDWSLVKNDKLWGHGISNNEIKDKENILVSNQGPCNKGYHIPSVEEWKGLIDSGYEAGIWGKGLDGESPVWTKEETEEYKISEQKLPKDLMLKLKLPTADYRHQDNANLLTRGTNAYFWTSTPSANYAFAFAFHNNGLINDKIYRARAYSIRCFKN